MITTFILTIFSAFANFLIGFLPNGNLPAGIAQAFAYFSGIINAFSYIIPVATLFQALLVVVGFDLAILLWHFIQWVIRKIPGMQ